MRYIQESGITKIASRETGALTFFPEGRTYSPPTKSAVYPPCGGRALYEATNKIGKELIAYRHIPS